LLALETTSFVPVKEWARKNLPSDNEIRAAILTEPDTGSVIEINMKLTAYSKVLDAKVRLMRK
jgi:hypothetical protein